MLTTTGFISQADFTHSLSTARNCTFGCTYCYVPTMGVYGGLKAADCHKSEVVETMRNRALGAGLRFGTGARAFQWLAEEHE